MTSTNRQPGLFETLQPLILASGSPRRKRLLESVGLDFRVETSSASEENGLGARTPAENAAVWARRKAAMVSKAFPESWVIGADTIVVLDGEIFGKPSGADEARRMLSRLGGRTHEVITGVCIAQQSSGTRRIESVITRVVFKPLCEAEIAAYVSTGEPLDKAGAYGIQGRGAFLVRSVAGSYTNVVGLPLCETIEWLIELKVIAPAVPIS